MQVDAPYFNPPSPHLRKSFSPIFKKRIPLKLNGLKPNHLYLFSDSDLEDAEIERAVTSVTKKGGTLRKKKVCTCFNLLKVN